MFERGSSPSELCYIAPYCEILKQNGYHIDEEFLFGVTGGIGFRYNYIHENKQVLDFTDTKDWVSIEGSVDIKDKIAELFGVRFVETVAEDKQLLLELCKKEIQKGHPVILFLDVYYLPYHPQFKQLHGQTNVLLYQIDGEQYDIYDKHVTTIPISVYEGSISEEVIFEALVCGTNSFNGREIGIITYEEPVFKKGVNLGEQLVYVADRMLNPQNSNEGVEGMKNLTEKTKKWDQYWDESNIKNVYRQAYHHITGRGGTYITSKAFASYIKNYIVCKVSNDRNVMMEMDKCTSLWQALAVKFFRNSVKPSGNALQELSGLLQELASLEEHIYSKILEIGGSMESDYFKFT